MTCRQMQHSRRNTLHITASWLQRRACFASWQGSCPDARGPRLLGRTSDFQGSVQRLRVQPGSMCIHCSMGAAGRQQRCWPFIRTWNISPAPSASLAVMMGVCTYRNPFSCRVGRLGRLPPAEGVSSSTAAENLVQTRWFDQVYTR
jgi:hypothetical protein